MHHKHVNHALLDNLRLVKLIFPNCKLRVVGNILRDLRIYFNIRKFKLLHILIYSTHLVMDHVSYVHHIVRHYMQALLNVAVMMGDTIEHLQIQEILHVHVLLQLREMLLIDLSMQQHCNSLGIPQEMKAQDRIPVTKLLLCGPVALHVLQQLRLIRRSQPLRLQ